MRFLLIISLRNGWMNLTYIVPWSMRIINYSIYTGSRCPLGGPRDKHAARVECRCPPTFRISLGNDRHRAATYRPFRCCAVCPGFCRPTWSCRWLVSVVFPQRNPPSHRFQALACPADSTENIDQLPSRSTSALLYKTKMWDKCPWSIHSSLVLNLRPE